MAKKAAGGNPETHRVHSGSEATRHTGDDYPPISDYAYISDCHSMALVSRSGSIDWCCMPRVDAASIFGRLLDWQKGGYCSVAPVDAEAASFQAYLEDTLVLETTFRTEGGEARLLDCFAMHEGGKNKPHLQLIRILEGVRGRIDFCLQVVPRFDYGEVKPWIRRHSARIHSAIGGNDGILVASDMILKSNREAHDLVAYATIRAEERIRISIAFVRPEELEFAVPDVADAAELDHRLEETIRWWRRWTKQITIQGSDRSAVVRSAIALKGLTFAPTGAMAAAATTSLPETTGGERNWDYRYSWIRDSALSVRSLTTIGAFDEADGFRRFIQRSAAGSASELQIMYGVGGERRLTEILLTGLDGYAHSRPVRIGNAASQQLQLDAYGALLDLSWRWHKRGHSPDDDYWRFVVELVDIAAERWSEPDRGIWEIRGKPQHFVHSKVMCWTALDRGIGLAVECLRKAPLARWRKTRKAIRDAVMEQGVDRDRKVFVQSFGSHHVDAALLLLPVFDFIGFDDPLMVATTDAIIADLGDDGLVLRYRVQHTDDGLRGAEGTFLACAFWLAEVLARQDRLEEARTYFDRASSTATELGLFSEEFATDSEKMLGNFPQALTHLSHISAAVALARAGGDLSSQSY
ncbi:MAG TPA: glycoside hydrolase family 15 protein [Candidatus Dormibacteraeota bacterium]|nr:glycoside hydrolase family 15 protein [Candidatus Dormibacteraeota bacterium]